MTNKIEELVDRYNVELDAFQKKGKELMLETFKEFFVSNPTIKTIVWNQFTPYFNDGDECVFSVNDMVFSTKEIDHIPDNPDEDNQGSDFQGDGLYDYQEINGKWIHVPIEGEKFAQRKVFGEFHQLIRTLPDEIFMSVFGDHKKILATIDGFDVEDCEHD